jgi:tetratricopeptide (TPR) repeat protein
MLVYLFSLGVILSLVVPSPAAPHLVQGVRFGWHNTYARIVFDMQGESPYQIVLTDEPTKVVVALPGVMQLPTTHVWRTHVPVIEEVRFVGTPGNIVAEILLRNGGTLQNHYRLSSPPRIVVDIVRSSTAATARDVHAGTQPSQGGERGVSPSLSLPGRDLAGEPVAPQEGKGKRARQGRKREALPQENKEPSLPQDAKAPHVPQPAGVQAIPDVSQPAGVRATPGQPLTPSPLSATLSEAELLSVAERQWQQGNFLAAQAAYQKFLERFPAYPHNHLIAVRLADMLQNRQQHRAAVIAYAQVMDAYPGSEGAMISEMRMAELGIQMPGLFPNNDDGYLKAYHAPLEALRQLLQTYPQSQLADVARFKIGVIQLQRREVQAALNAFTDLLHKPLKDSLKREIQAKHREALQTAIAGWQEQGKYAEVLRTFFQHKALLPPQEAESPDFLLPVALSYARLGLLPEAQSLFQVQLQTVLPPAQRGVIVLEQVNILVARGLLPEAKSLLKSSEAQAAGAVRGQMLSILGKLALQMGQAEEAVQYLRRAQEMVSSPPERASLYALLGEGYRSQGREQEGQQAFQQCIEIAMADAQAPLPSAETCLLRAASLLGAQRQYEAAFSMYEKLLATFPQTGFRNVALLQMATLSRSLANPERMQSMLSTLRETSPSPMWQRVATDMVDEAAWQQQFHERLADLQNSLMR